MAKGLVEKAYLTALDVKAKVFTFVLSMAVESMGEKSTIIPPLRFSNLHLMRIGRNVTIHTGCWMQALSMVSDDGSPKIILEDGVGIGMNSTISAAVRIHIGRQVFTARNIYISDHGHEFRDVNVPIADQSISEPAPVTIKDFSWLGQNVVVLPGVTIGKHSTIGANSVVNKDIPDYCVAAGVPARVIRRYNPATDQWAREL